MSLADDPLWLRFNDRAFRCHCCDRSFNGIFDIAFDHPDPWPHGFLREHDGEVLEVGEDFLGTDLCRLDEHRFVRGLIEIPILDSGQHFSFGAWASLHPDNFSAYVAAYGTEDELKVGPCFGWMTNALPVYGTGMALKTEVTFRGGGRRPTFDVWDESSHLHRDQQIGISFSQLLDLYAASGIDVRSHLLDR